MILYHKFFSFFSHLLHIYFLLVHYVKITIFMWLTCTNFFFLLWSLVCFILRKDLSQLKIIKIFTSIFSYFYGFIPYI